ncbi:MAG: hypothetical protein ACRDY7_05810 [Acidimicrobiia bacterium]
MPSAVAPPTPASSLLRSPARARGAYYTPSVAATVLAGFALDGGARRILEPSMGEGVFVDALAVEGRRRGVEPDVWGVEIDPAAHAATVARGGLPPERARCADFLAVRPFPVDAVVGNPPFVRLRHLPAPQARRAAAVAEGALGVAMDPSGSVWMPFVLHATRFLARRGRLALVLPYDATYVRYARPLWRHLAGCFGDIEVVRVRQRMFPELCQDVVLLLAGEHGGTTSHVVFRAYPTLRPPFRQQPSVVANLDIPRIVAGERVFTEALLPAAARRLVAAPGTAAVTAPARQVADFHIGYVCGDKRYFHPDAATAARFELPAGSLRATLMSGRSLAGAGLHTSSVAAGRLGRLWLPPGDPGSLAAGERRYVEAGVGEGVAGRYKCRVRTPWYVTPGVRIPDVVVPVFTERPVMLINDAGMAASNSLICGYLRQGHAEGLAAAWFTSLTLLQFELEIHALGGGVMVLVPREAGNLRLPLVPTESAHLSTLDRLLSAGRADEAFAAGDDAVLRRQLGFAGDDIDVLREAVAVLRWWRTAGRR